MSTGDGLRRPWWSHLSSVWLAVAVGTLLRAALFAGVDLYEDEAYYWLWSRRLALGYYDQAPMVGWLIRLTSWLVPGELGVRIAFVVLGGVAVLLTARIARELSDAPEAPALAAWLTAITPMLIFTGALALPDSPETAAYACLIWLACRARGPRWLAVGAAWGVALLSKYTAYFLLPGLVVLVVLDREFRAELRTRWPWLGGVTALLVFLPNLWWNATHDFVTFRFAFQRGYAGSPELGHLLEFVGVLLLGTGPIVAVVGIGALVWPTTTAARRVAAFTLVPLGCFAGSAILRGSEPNWLAFLYPGLCAASAAGLLRMRARWRTRLVASSVVFGCLLFAVAMAELRNPAFLDPTRPPFRRMVGGRDLVAKVQQALGSSTEPFIIPSRYQIAAYLAYYGGWQRFGPAYLRASQLDIWNDRPAPGEPIVVVAYDRIEPGVGRRLGLAGQTIDTIVDVVWNGRRIYRVGVAKFAGRGAPIAERR